MRRIGSHVSSAGSICQALDRVGKVGGNCLQFFAGSPRMWARKLYAPDECKKFILQAQQRDLSPVFIHALYLVNLASDNPLILRNSHHSLLLDLKNGDQINSAGVVIHLGSHQGRGFEAVSPQLLEEIFSLLSQSSSTPFIIENSAGQKGKIGSLEEISFLVNTLKSDRVKICLDSAHLFSAGFDLRQNLVINQLISKLNSLGLLDSLAILHLNDSQTPLGSSRDIHANLGQGQIGLAGLGNFLNHPALSHLPVILEVPGSDKKGTDKENMTTALSLLGV
ncbi:deoxyribonuclease IV [Candidatus Collierbacteria bacterium]|nr:deoxyribonuclease IV [Candidatus Collierbacteria bacterium]